MRYRSWLQTLAFDHPAPQIALQEMLQAERNALERLERLTGQIEALVPDWTLAPAGSRRFISAAKGRIACVFW